MPFKDVLRKLLADIGLKAGLRRAPDLYSLAKEQDEIYRELRADWPSVIPVSVSAAGGGEVITLVVMGNLWRSHSGGLGLSVLTESTGTARSKQAAVEKLAKAVCSRLSAT